MTDVFKEELHDGVLDPNELQRMAVATFQHLDKHVVNNRTLPMATQDGSKQEQLWGKGELGKRLGVLVALVGFLAFPMWVWPTYCDAVLWTVLMAGFLEWWLAVCRSGCLSLQNVALMVLAFTLWAAPTVPMIARYKEVVGHRKMTECIIIQLTIGDTAQLLCGRLFGHHHICGALSPKKTLEGYLGGGLVTWLYGSIVHGWSVRDVGLAFIAGCVGDLYFSAVKRHLGIKDFSRALAAHGGILDRIDSFLFAANALFWCSA